MSPDNGGIIGLFMIVNPGFLRQTTQGK
jgi:hypothetical protein